MSTTQQVKRRSERKTGLKDYYKHRLNLIIDEFSDWTRGGDWQVQEGFLREGEADVPPQVACDVTKGQIDLPGGHSASRSSRLKQSGGAILKY